MPTSRDPLTERHVADALRALASEHAREREPFDKRRAWQRIEQRNVQLRSSSPRASHWRASLAAAVFATGALLGGLYFKSAAALRYQVRGATLREGSLSTESTPAELEFSDESHISASPHSAFSVDIVGKHAALTRLAQGKLHVKVHHAADTNWHFFAGRYEVQVVGTEFDLAWDDKTESLSLSMVSGEVRVLGAPGAPRVVKAGGSLRLPESLPGATPAVPAMAPDSSAVSAAIGGANATRAALDDAVPNGPKPIDAQSSAHSGGDAAQLSWDALLQTGQFAAVVQSAEASGLEHTLQTASASNLKALAQAARYTGRAPLSLRAWQALRSRFASQPIGAQASFFLGRSYEEQGNAAQALRWLGTYMSEAPSGVYASEALGRRLVLLAKNSGKTAALSSARDYLQRFPGGAYEKSARAIVEAE